MNDEDILAGVLILIIVILIVVVISAFILVSGYLATAMGLNGMNWWAMAIVTFLLLTGFVLMINRIGSD